MKRCVFGRLAIVIMFIGILGFGCNSSDPTPSAGASSGPANSGTANPPANSANATTLGVAIGTLGSYLADSSGKSLYVFDLDSFNQSNCIGACALVWPPLTVGSGQIPTVGGVINSQLSGILTRADGSTQVTYNGLPLYYYSGDQVAGDTNGEGITSFGASWWLLKPEGTKLTTNSSTANAICYPNGQCCDLYGHCYNTGYQPGYHCDSRGHCCDINNKNCLDGQVDCDSSGRCCDSNHHCVNGGFSCDDSGHCCDSSGHCFNNGSNGYTCDMKGRCCDSRGDCYNHGGSGSGGGGPAPGPGSGTGSGDGSGPGSNNGQCGKFTCDSSGHCCNQCNSCYNAAH